MYDDYKFVTRKDLENLGETLLLQFLLTNVIACAKKKKTLCHRQCMQLVSHLVFGVKTQRAKEITIQRGALSQLCKLNRSV